MITKELDCFNIAQICDSGQCFRMRQKRDNLYSVIAGNEYLEVTQNGGNAHFTVMKISMRHFGKSILI